MLTVLCYALCGAIIVICKPETDLDMMSVPYVSTFLALGLTLFVVWLIIYFKMKKGVSIDDEQIKICIGYPEKYHSLHTKIELSEITSVGKAERVNYKEEKRFYVLISYGTILKDLPVLKIATGGEHPKMHLVQCENIDGLIKQYEAFR